MGVIAQRRREMRIKRRKAPRAAEIMKQRRGRVVKRIYFRNSSSEHPGGGGTMRPISKTFKHLCASAPLREYFIS
jgi:hypothetical protein